MSPGFRSARSSTIADVPVRPNLISIYLPPPVLLKILPDIAAKGCDELWLNPGTESDEALALAEQLKLNHPITNEPVVINSPLPKDFKVALKYLRQYSI